MNPPGIGEALGKGWEATKPHFVPAIIASLVAYLLCIIPIVGAFFAYFGFFNIGLKLIRGQKPEIGDALIGIKGDVLNKILITLLPMIGCIICALPGLFTFPVFHHGIFLALDGKLKTWGEAKEDGMTKMKPTWVAWAIFCVVVMIVGGLCACITMPIGMAALAYAYEKARGGGGGAEPAKA
jgi:uncharacterized membrane protein